MGRIGRADWEAAVASTLQVPLPHRRGPIIAWLVCLVVAAAPLALDVRGHVWGETRFGLQVGLSRMLASVIAVLFAVALSWRLGGRPLVPVGLVVVFAAAAQITAWSVLLSGAAVGLACLSAALALMITVPAADFKHAAAETVIAGLLATIGGLGVAGIGAHVKEGRFGAIALLVTLSVAFVMVFRLGAGFHGLGRRGYVVAGGATVILLVSLVYGAAFSRWGSHDVVAELDSIRDAIRDHLYAVPHPIEAVLGVPALCWGIFMRARRRQGWWVCAFGAAFTAPSAARFTLTGVPLSNALVSILYTLIIGFTIAWLVIRADQRLTGNRGRRARRVEEAVALRPEPDRGSPLR